MNPENINLVTTENLHKTIIQFIKDGEIIISEYDDMKECILKMIRASHFFNMDRDRLRDAMEDITFMMCPTDDINKDRVSRGLEYEYSDEESGDEESDDDGFDGQREAQLRYLAAREAAMDERGGDAVGGATEIPRSDIEEIGTINDGSAEVS